jgi:hypothetical protein
MPRGEVPFTVIAGPDHMLMRSQCVPLEHHRTRVSHSSLILERVGTVISQPSTAEILRRLFHTFENLEVGEPAIPSNLSHELGLYQGTSSRRCHSPPNMARALALDGVDYDKACSQKLSVNGYGTR